jgi:hypothetical protein
MSERNTELEKEFLKAKEEAEKEIQKYVDEASHALRKAVKASENYGIPFYSHISFLSNTYTPRSYDEKWSEVDQDWASDVADIYSDGYPGWQHSAVC